jgi:hypothetical protein
MAKTMKKSHLTSLRNCRRSKKNEYTVFSITDDTLDSPKETLLTDTSNKLGHETLHDRTPI